jgi:hypothetical protein
VSPGDRDASPYKQNSVEKRKTPGMDRGKTERRKKMTYYNSRRKSIMKERS